MKLRLFTISAIAAFLLSQCEPYFWGGGSSAYLPPLSPGDVTELDGTKSIQPESKDTYLTNPGIGWQDGPEPFGFMNFPETVSYSNRRQIGWSVLNPQKGKYDWSALDQQLDAAVESGKQFSFRVYTFVGEGFAGDMLPPWVLKEGAVLLLPTGEPDYSNCVYQEEFGIFVDELRHKYDGNTNIAFIDISGYGNFNEWSWEDTQTEWDEQWEDDYANGVPSAASFQTLDGQARRRLADMFLGGSFEGHSCRMANGDVAQLNYSYEGFQNTQLVMPYAGIAQSTQYVFFRRPDVGFRHDCLGRVPERVYEKVGTEIDQIWQHAPVVFELCKPDEVEFEDAKALLQMSHGSIVHNNNWKYSIEQLQDMMAGAGYRYLLQQADLAVEDGQLVVHMDWQNNGSAPSYPKMGQDFSLHFYLVNKAGKPVLNHEIPADISTWLPADTMTDESPVYSISETMAFPFFFRNGDYYAGVSILDRRTGLPIQLGFGSPDRNGISILFPTTINK